MATLPPRPSKRQKTEQEERIAKDEEEQRIPEGLDNVRIQFVDQATGQNTGTSINLPVSQSSTKNLELLLNSLLDQGNELNDSTIPYRFSLRSTTDESVDIVTDLYKSVLKPGIKSTEDVILLEYTPEAVFRVRPVTRCSAAISGHASNILAIQFSPTNSSRVVSGSGDGKARIWDCDTGTPYKMLEGHTNWVLAVSYSPDGSMIATGSMDNTVRIWEAKTGKPVGSALKGHKKWITSLSWEPFHLQETGRPRIASSSKDATVRIWDIVGGRTDFQLARHQGTVSCVKWGGTDKIYTTSHDKTVKIWESRTGNLIKSVATHAHWVNHLSLSTDAVLRTAYHDHTGKVPETIEGKKARALERFREAATVNGKVRERFVTASDDCTMFLWDADDFSKPVARMTGHQKSVNHVCFSADGHYIASCGFDNHVKLWNATDGKFIRTMRAHVAAVYQCSFSSDSRLLVSASKDTTIKAWDVRTGKMVEDLPGHKDEVFAVDWSPDGKRVASGGKDKQIRIWSN